MNPSLSMPEVLPRPGGWQFLWKPEDISVRLERLREHHDSITAELWVEQGKGEHILGGLRFSLTTTTGRGSVAKALRDRRNGIDWGGMMEQVCVYSLRKFREQETITDIGSLPVSSDLQFRLRTVLPEGVTTILFGYGGMAKSTIAIAWGLLVQLGETRLALTPTKGSVLLLDWETNREIANKIQRELHKGMILKDAPFFHYLRCRRPLTEFIEDIKAFVEREKVALVICDSLAKACGSERIAKEEAVPTMDALGSLGTTVLAIAHRPKGDEGKQRGIYGSVFVENDARQAFQVEAKVDPVSGASDVVLFHTKHNLMAQLPPFSYRIEWDKAEGTKIQVQNVGETEFRTRLHAVDQIYQALRKGSLNIAEINEETQLKEDTIRKTLDRYEGKKFVKLGGEPVQWGIKTTLPPEAFR